jgi:hypothetical protein
VNRAVNRAVTATALSVYRGGRGGFARHGALDLVVVVAQYGAVLVGRRAQRRTGHRASVRAAPSRRRRGVLKEE